MKLSQQNEKSGAGNHFLASLPSVALAALDPFLTSVSFDPEQIVIEIGQVINCFYFPTSGFCSLQTIMKDGRAADTALVGRESVLEPLAAWGERKSTVRCIARTTLLGKRISTVELKRAAEEHGVIAKACIDYGDALLSQTRINGARTSLALIDARLAACMLEVSDLLEAETLPLSQELLASLLSVRRTSITEAAGKLKNAGLIDYSRGKVTILDRRRLGAIASV
jgi:CRP-like cAMP-binding protein